MNENKILTNNNFILFEIETIQNHTEMRPSYPHQSCQRLTPWWSTTSWSSTSTSSTSCSSSSWSPSSSSSTTSSICSSLGSLVNKQIFQWECLWENVVSDIVSSNTELLQVDLFHHEQHLLFS